MFVDPSIYPWVPVLEADWREVREELDALEQTSFEDWPERHLYTDGWRVFGFRFLGRRFEDNEFRCPRTARLLEQIPGLISAGFSYLRPGTEIAPHIGYSHSLFVCHLALDVPPDCGIEVNGEVRGWEAGKVMVFDDMMTHRAWNHSERRRVVLLMEVERPGRTFREAAMSGELRTNAASKGWVSS